jgi:DNA-binding FrmR family transcriptional regulator
VKTPVSKKSVAAEHHHPDHSSSKKRINRVKGQLDAVSRMIDERKYCPDIIQQIRAAKSALQGLEFEILEGHIQGCVHDAIHSKDERQVKTKIDEIMTLMKR